MSSFNSKRLRVEQKLASSASSPREEEAKNSEQPRYMKYRASLSSSGANLQHQSSPESNDDSSQSSGQDTCEQQPKTPDRDHPSGPPPIMSPQSAVSNESSTGWGTGDDSASLSLGDEEDRNLRFDDSNSEAYSYDEADSPVPVPPPGVSETDTSMDGYSNIDGYDTSFSNMSDGTLTHKDDFENSRWKLEEATVVEPEEAIPEHRNEEVEYMSDTSEEEVTGIAALSRQLEAQLIPMMQKRYEDEGTAGIGADEDDYGDEDSKEAIDDDIDEEEGIDALRNRLEAKILPMMQQKQEERASEAVNKYNNFQREDSFVPEPVKARPPSFNDDSGESDVESSGAGSQASSDENGKVYDPSKIFHYPRGKSGLIVIICCAIIALAIVLPLVLLNDDEGAGDANRSGSPPVVAPTLPQFTFAPTSVPSTRPTSAPTVSPVPTERPSASPTRSPTQRPSASPTLGPTNSPAPTTSPTRLPTTTPSFSPVASPSAPPTSSPTTTDTPILAPTTAPTREPTLSPTTTSPDFTPTAIPVGESTGGPTTSPSSGSPASTPPPTIAPSRSTTISPTSSNPVSTPLPTRPLSLLDVLTSASSDGGAALNTDGTPQNQAYLWLDGTSNLDSLPAERWIQRYALVTFFYATSGNGWGENGGWLTEADECGWDLGSREPCNTNGEIVALEMTFNNVFGSIPPEIGMLEALESLSLSNNRIRGTLPTELATLSNLQSISFRANFFTGDLPTFEQLTNLVSVDLSSNRLTSSIPLSLGKLTTLERVYLGRNELTGMIPPDMGSSGRLSVFSLERNRLSGAVPTSLLSSASTLNTLRLDVNQLTSLPVIIGGLTNLRTLNAAENEIAGQLPPLQNLQQLTQLDMRDNLITGILPDGLADLKVLRILSLSYNLLEGRIPDTWGSLTLLRSVELHENALTGGIPSSLTSLTALEILSLDRNDLTINVSPAICMLDLSVFRTDCGVDSNGERELICDCCTICCVDGGPCVPN